MRTKQKLTPHKRPTPPRWDVCEIPQALLAALKLRERKNKLVIYRVYSPIDMSLPQFTKCFSDLPEKKKNILINLTSRRKLPTILMLMLY